MRRTATLLAVLFFAASAVAQEDKKTDDLKPADPDTGESTVEETTLGLLPQPLRTLGDQVRGDLYRRSAGQSFGRLEERLGL